ncbi:acyl-CoA dehydrogenase family protein [Streptomyces sp. NPDC023723]|uniref:acyl-CoA dehydrogenase family protein n=1 Tax=Streptomyces sp. NPDC023723 TaxID=3154323 RepID=UPI0033C8EFDD
MSEYEKVLLADAADTERHSRLTAAGVAALRGSGALALRTPIEYGGQWCDAPTVTRRLTELGRVCPSAAWIAGTCATAKTMVALRHDARVRGEFFADPGALACGSGLPTGRGVPEAGGVRVTGQWDNVSGCESAEWANLSLMVDGGYHLAVVPLVDLAIERNWHMAGMRGTGSQRLVADGLLVPAHRVARSGPPQPQEQLFFGLCLLAPIVGAAQGALDAVRDMFRSDRKPFMTSYTSMGDSPGARHWLADASSLVDRAGRTALAIAQDSTRDDLTDLDRAHLRASMAGAAKDCRDAVELMLDLHGASGFRETNSLQRYWRDVAVGSRHPAFSTYLTTENLGTALIS